MLTKALNRGMRLSFIIVTLFITTVNAVTDAQEAPTIFGDVTISPQFSPDPLIVRGMSGGSISGNQVGGRSETATGPCT
ncbi:MAG: hypothetical protein ICV54_06655, partial [Nostoc sp. C3-bin3]|nr:hypothetical protein [Nostoc sp. C3-bin3]